MEVYVLEILTKEDVWRIFGIYKDEEFAERLGKNLMTLDDNEHMDYRVTEYMVILD